jgi:F0F1-type ATP synthase membrane subunit b/b'
MADDKTRGEKIQELVDETLDKISEVMDGFYEKAGEIIKGDTENEKVEEAVEKIQKIRKDISEGTNDAIRNITRMVADLGENVSKLFKRKKDEDDD